MASDWDNRRRHPRFTIAIQVEIGRGGEIVELQSENVSLGGLFLSTDQDLVTSGEEVTLHLVLPGAEGSQKVPVRGTVAHVIPPLGFGVSFSLPEDDPAYLHLKAYVGRLEQIRASVDDVLAER